MIDLIKAKMKDKEKLSKLVKIIGDLLKIEGNEWLVNELLKTIDEKSHVEEIEKHPLLHNIHEYCVEKIIEKQANEFYASVSTLEIKDELIKDYIKMEHERRRDDFSNFCLCMYQQIENITNHIYNIEVKDGWEEDRSKKVPDYSKGEGEQTIEDLINKKSGSKWTPRNKFKAFLIYYYFNKEFNQNDVYKFHQLFAEYDKLYAVRNTNHRGGELFGSAPAILKDIKGNESKMYFRFYSFLQDVISKNIEYFPNLKEYKINYQKQREN